MVVLITGCRSGFGLLTAIEAARRGHKVYAGFRDLQTVAEVGDRFDGLDITPVALDVTKQADREAVVAQILAEHGKIDALINNAGIALGGFLEQLDEDEFRQVFEVNIMGLWALTKTVLPSMRERKQGVILNVGSESGKFAFPGVGAYCASKHALEALTEAWRGELAPWGIRVVLLGPGSFRTDIWGRNRRVGRHALDPFGPYALQVRAFERVIASASEDKGEDPQIVADKLCELLEDPHPRFRYAIGHSATARNLAKTLLPRRIFEAALARILKPTAKDGERLAQAQAQAKAG